MKPCRGVLILVVVAVGLVLAIAWYELRRGFSARGEPSRIETWIATTARRLAVPATYRELPNVVPASSENIRAGMEHFANHCATCHANDGSGDTMFGKGLYPKPPDMRLTETQNKSDGELYYTIENGVRLSGMPAFGEEHATRTVTETWQLVLFIRHLPQLTTPDLKEMEQLNPKTEEERAEEKQEQEFLNGARTPEKPAGERNHHH